MSKRLYLNFLRFCPNFWQIKTFVGALSPPAPIHHCTQAQGDVYA